MPAAAPAITRAECAAAGAELYLVDGLIGDAGKLVAAAVARRPGYQDTSTLREPYRIEGKKTMGLEIAEQLGWRLPGVIVYPTGGGVGIIGIYKALRELLELGWVSGDLPRLVAVQAAGCAPIVRAFQAGATASEPWPDAKTVAFGITVPNALGDFLILEALYATGGTAVAVTDEALLADQRAVARLEGSFICPEGAACVTAVRQLRESGWLAEIGRGRRAQHRHRADLPGHRAGPRARAPAVRLDSARTRDADGARLGRGRDHPRQGRDLRARPDLDEHAGRIHPAGRRARVHDLPHLVVESLFGIEDGLWGVLARGGFGAANLARTRSRGRRARLVTDVPLDDLGARNWRGHIVAKAATNAVMNRWQEGPDTPDGVRARLRPGARRTRITGSGSASLLGRLDDATIALAISGTRELSSAWARLPAGGMLRLQWPLPRWPLPAGQPAG